MSLLISTIPGFGVTEGPVGLPLEPVLASANLDLNNGDSQGPLLILRSGEWG